MPPEFARDVEFHKLIAGREDIDLVRLMLEFATDAYPKLDDAASLVEIERLGLSAMSLGMARRCLDTMVKYSTERRTFGAPIHEHGQIQRYIGDSYAKVEAMRALIYDIAATVGPGRRNRLGTDAAKLFSSTAAKEVADNAIQVLGGYGYCTEYRVEQFWRDAKLIEIGGGTLEAHQKNITRDLTRG